MLLLSLRSISGSSMRVLTMLQDNFSLLMRSSLSLIIFSLVVGSLSLSINEVVMYLSLIFFAILLAFLY